MERDAAMSFHTVNRRRKRAVRATLWILYVVSSFGLLAGLIAAEVAWPAVFLVTMAVVAGLVVADRWMRDEGGIPVLYYHSISDKGWLPWPSCIVSCETFERHLDMLARTGMSVISTADLVTARQEDRVLPIRPVAIDIDDGYLDTWVAALPLLQRYGFPATLFVSLDFIEDGNELRPTIDDVEARNLRPDGLTWTGYVNWSELAAMQRGGLMDIQAHGVDHGRVETGPAVVDHLTVDNWRHLAWLQWLHMRGSKVDWYRSAVPPGAALATAVHENAPALAARAWREGIGLESETAYEVRVRQHLQRSKDELEHRLGKPVDVFCWPENGTSAAARLMAEAVGYRATTAGEGENRIDEDPRVISRMGVGDRVAGWHWPAAEAAGLYAAIRTFQGNYYWYFLLVALALLRRLHSLVAWQHPQAAPSRTAAPPQGAPQQF